MHVKIGAATLALSLSLLSACAAEAPNTPAGTKPEAKAGAADRDRGLREGGYTKLQPVTKDKPTAPAAEKPAGAPAQ